MVGALVEFTAAIVAGHGAFDRLHPVNDGETIRADVSVVPFHFAAFEGQRVERLLAGNSEVHASSLPLGAMRIDAAAATPFVGDEMREFVLQCAPEFLRLAVSQLGIEFDGAVRPPRATGCRLHP